MTTTYLGIDIGSATTAVALIDNNAELADHIIFPTRPRHTDTVSEIKDFLFQHGHNPIRGVSTGIGRKNIDIASQQSTEITCQAKGINHLFPDVRVVIDIGGQDNKAIKISPNGKVNDFVMNDKCAAGTGRFMEIVGTILDLNVKNLGEIGSGYSRDLKISNSCVVFAETEIIGHISRNVPVPDIVHGIHRALSERVFALVRRIEMAPQYALCGGMANNDDFTSCLSELVGETFYRPPIPQLTGALGAALIAKENAVGRS